MESIKLEEIIKKILEEHEYTRISDMYLFYVYVYKTLKNKGYRENQVDKVFTEIFYNPRERKSLGIQSFGAVERIRRKVQADNEHLQKDKVAKLNQTEKYIEYSQGYNVNF